MTARHQLQRTGGDSSVLSDFDQCTFSRGVVRGGGLQIMAVTAYYDSTFQRFFFKVYFSNQYAFFLNNVLKHCFGIGPGWI